MIGAVTEPAEPRVTVCLPTYNERENLRPMIAALRRVLPESARILVIDDGSPDGTGKLADEFAETDQRVSVLHRERKEGLGPAYIAGFERALADGAELIVEIDCDFSHDPNDVPRLLAAAEDADVVLGSRYVAGSAVRDWGRGRRFISKGGSAYARIVLGTKVHDPTGGFKCFRRRVLETIPLDRVSSQGLRLPDRDDVPRGTGRLPRRRGADHVRRPRGRPLEDEPGDHFRGDLARPVAPGARPVRTAVGRGVRSIREGGH